jgi:RNA-directed DNA polymerase
MNFVNQKNKANKWQTINWNQVETLVSCMQRKIGVAKRENDLETMKRLQQQLVLKFEARALAVRRVTSNQGSKTPGIDKGILKNPSDKWEMIGNLGE